MARILKPQPVYPPDWQAFPWERLTILSFDASMANTGWTVSWFAPNTRPVIVEYGTIVTKPIFGSGFEDSLARGEMLMDGAHDVMVEMICCKLLPDVIIHEMPKAMGRGAAPKGKAEAPPISAMAVRAGVRMAWHCQRENGDQPPIIMVQNQHMKKVLFGYNDTTITKAMVRQAVWDAGVQEFRTNEHVADSMALAITHQIDLRDARELAEWRRLTGKEARE